MSQFHEYSVEWEKSDLVYRLDGKEVHRNIGLGDNYHEPMFAILNFAKITTRVKKKPRAIPVNKADTDKFL